MPVMATFAEIADEAESRYMVERGVSHRQIAIYFQNIYPNVRGINERSVRRYCKYTDLQCQSRSLF